MLTDTHCHLTDPQLHSHIAEILQRARCAGVCRIITVGTDPADWQTAVEVAKSHPGVAAVLGLHPHEAKSLCEEHIARLKNLLHNERAVALGEVGLDYHYNFSEPAVQRQAFEEQLKIAVETNLPAVIHCREAFEDAMSILDEFRGRLKAVIFHCFSGSVDEARKVLNRGYYISLAGIVTFRSSAELKEVATFVPDDRLLLETDAPYLTPEPIRKVRPNEPAHLVHTARCVAELRKVDMQKLCDICERNVEAVFEALPAEGGTTSARSCTQPQRQEPRFG